MKHTMVNESNLCANPLFLSCVNLDFRAHSSSGSVVLVLMEDSAIPATPASHFFSALDPSFSLVGVSGRASQSGAACVSHCAILIVDVVIVDTVPPSSSSLRHKTKAQSQLIAKSQGVLLTSSVLRSFQCLEILKNHNLVTK